MDLQRWWRLIVKGSNISKLTRPQGDQSPPYSGAGDPSRSDSYTVASAGTIVNPYIQGGERFQTVTLTTPGTVTLQAIGIQFAGYRATPDDYAGYFVCSSDQLNQIWYTGAYTAQLDQLPANIVPLPWHGTSTGLIAHRVTTPRLKILCSLST
jgi:alpha-L-rhamnosidase